MDIYQNAMNFEAIAKQTDVKNIAEYRQIFEIGAIQLAAKRATEKNVTRLREILKKMEEVPEDSVALSQYDFEFHAYLMKMTHNELLIVMFNSIRNAYKNLTESIFAMGCLPTTINEHLAIVDAIADHDSALDRDESDDWTAPVKKESSITVNVIKLRTGANTPVLNFRFFSVFRKIARNKLLLSALFYRKALNLMTLLILYGSFPIHPNSKRP